MGMSKSAHIYGNLNYEAGLHLRIFAGGAYCEIYNLREGTLCA